MLSTRELSIRPARASSGCLRCRVPVRPLRSNASRRQERWSAKAAQQDRDGLSARDPILRVADLNIDTVSHEVRRAGKLIDLTSKEYAILEYFARNPNRVLTRTQIAEHVWDFDFVSMSNAIDVYIGYLRRKLGDDSEPRLLRTIRGTGYQFRVPSA